MRIHVTLHSYLREKLPPEAKGQAFLEFPSGVTIREVIAHLDLPAHVLCAVNDKIEYDKERALNEGDSLRFFRPGAGG